MTINTINDGAEYRNAKTRNLYLKLSEIQSRDIRTLTPTKWPLSTFVCIEIQHDSDPGLLYFLVTVIFYIQFESSQLHDL